MLHVSAFFTKLHVRQMLLAGVILIPALGILVYQAILDHEQAKAGLEQEARLVALQVGMFSKDALPDPEIYLTQLAALPELSTSKPNCGDYMETWLKADYFFDNIFFASPEGEIICSGVPNIRSNIAERGYFRRAIQTKKYSIGDYQRTMRDDVPILVFALPVVNSSGELTMVIGAAARLTWFQQAFDRAERNLSLKDISASAIDENGLILASVSDQAVIGQRLKNWNEDIKHEAKKGIYVRAENSDGGYESIAAYLTLYRSSSSSIYLRVVLPQQEALRLVAKQTQNRIAILLAFVVATILLASWLSSWLVIKPIRRLTYALSTFTVENPTVRAKLGNSGGEIGELTKNFDAMVERLMYQHAELAQLTKLWAIRCEVSASVLRAEDEVTLLGDVCDIVRRGGGFDLVLATNVNPGSSSKPTSPKWSAGDALASSIDCIFEAKTEGVISEPLTIASHSGSVFVVRNSDLGISRSLQVSMEALGCSALVGLPIPSFTSGTVGGLAIYSSKLNDFNEAQIEMLTEIANDIGAGIGALRAGKSLRESDDLLRMIVDHIPTMIFVKDTKDFTFVSMNRAGEKLTGRSASEFLGKTDFDLFSREQAEYFREKDQLALIAREAYIVTDEPLSSINGEIRLLETTKIIIRGGEGSPKYLLGISEDITERRRAEHRLQYLATHDELTGLLNRYGLLSQMQPGGQQEALEQDSYAVLYVDLDGFKEVNDSLGHPIGDALLKEVASVLSDPSVEAHTVARVGGDEFIITMPDEHEFDRSVVMAEKIRQRCEKPFFVEGREIFISASIGISVFSPQVDRFEEALRTSDIAMYHAKRQGRNRYAVYSSAMHAQAVDRIAMRNHLRHAIGQEELTLHYQPRVSIETGKIVGAEALLRWTNPRFGAVQPSVFIPLAEENGLIVAIGAWVLRHACAQAQAWKEAMNSTFVMAVNLSPRQLRHPAVLEMIEDVLKDSGWPAESLELEITETAVMDFGSAPIDVLKEISKLGVRLAIDDFGTGYSNLAYLKRLPFDVLKVDKSFVAGMTSDKNDLALVTAIVAMADSLSLSVTAEGIETSDQLTALRKLRVADYQGYFFAPPMPADEFLQMLMHERQRMV